MLILQSFRYGAGYARKVMETMDRLSELAGLSQSWLAPGYRLHGHGPA
jgi:hypothetical protein